MDSKIVCPHPHRAPALRAGRRGRRTAVGCKDCELFRLARFALPQDNHRPPIFFAWPDVRQVAELTEPRPDSDKANSRRQFQHQPDPDPDRSNIPRRRGRAGRRGFASNSDSLRVVARFAYRHLKTVPSPFHKRRRRYSPLSGRESHVRPGRIADHLKVLVDAADDSGTRTQSHRDTQRTDHFCKHCGNVVGQVCLATSKPAGEGSFAIPKSNGV